MTTVIQLTDVHKRYENAEVEVHALRGVSLTIRRGEFVAIMGASGSGKSTLMNTLGCLDPPTSGCYLLDDVSVEFMDRNQLASIRNRKLGFVFQGYNLLSRTTALENVELPMLCGGQRVEAHEVQQRARLRLEQVGLNQRADHFPNQLSGGQQQRVAIARALVNYPEVLLADEPTGNLDTKTSKEIMGIFQALNDAGVTIVLVTHEPDIAAYCKRCITLRDGEIIEDAPVEGRTVLSEQLASIAKSELPIVHTSEQSGLLINFSIVLKVALRSLRRTLVRSSLSALGVIIGVALVIALVSIGNGARAEVEKDFALISPNLLTVGASMPRKMWRNNQPMKVPYGDGLQLGDYEAIRENIGDIERSTVMLVASQPEVTANGQSSAAIMMGLDVDGFDLFGRRILEGSTFGQADVNSSATVALISENIAESLFGDSDPIGQLIHVKSMPFVVIGVMEDNVPTVRSTEVDVSDKTMIVPYTSVLRRIDRTAPIYIFLQARRAEDLSALQAETTALLSSRWGSRIAELNTGDVEKQIREATERKRTMTLLLGAMGSISLLVGAIGIMNIMLVSVTERTREIGIRLAIGTRGRDILLQFLFEAVIITLLGGFIGIMVGAGGAYLLSYFNGWTTLITANTVLVAILLSAAVGILSGVLPARRAAALDPIQALRSE